MTVFAYIQRIVEEGDEEGKYSAFTKFLLDNVFVKCLYLVWTRHLWVFKQVSGCKHEPCTKINLSTPKAPFVLQPLHIFKKGVKLLLHVQLVERCCQEERSATLLFLVLKLWKNGLGRIMATLVHRITITFRCVVGKPICSPISKDREIFVDQLTLPQKFFLLQN